MGEEEVGERGDADVGRRRRRRRRCTKEAEGERQSMTTVIDISGVNNVCQNLLTYDLHGGERISALQTDYPDQDRESYVAKADNIAPRPKNWKPSKSNTQMPPTAGKGSDEKPQVQARRGPKYFGKLNKLL